MTFTVRYYGEEATILGFETFNEPHVRCVVHRLINKKVPPGTIGLAIFPCPVGDLDGEEKWQSVTQPAAVN